MTWIRRPVAVVQRGPGTPFIAVAPRQVEATAYSLVSSEDICWLPSPGVDTTGIVEALIEQAQEGRVSLTGVTSGDGTVTYTYDSLAATRVLPCGK